MMGDLIKEMRQARNMTQTELAILMGTYQPKVAMWESCRVIPERDSLVKLAKIFDVSVDKLIRSEYGD